MNGISLTKLIAFMKRDFLIESSYKAAFLISIQGSILPIFSFYFIAKSIDDGSSPSLAPYGGDYFSFVLIGVAFTQYFMTALRSFAETIRRAQTAGVLEAILSTQTDPQAVILLTSAYSFVSSTIHVAIVFLVGGVFLGVDYANANWLSAFLTLALAMVSFLALGILAATAILVLKKGDPIEWIVGSLSSLLGGALFPVSVMPDWMQLAGRFLPDAAGGLPGKIGSRFVGSHINTRGNGRAASPCKSIDLLGRCGEEPTRRKPHAVLSRGGTFRRRPPVRHGW